MVPEAGLVSINAADHSEMAWERGSQFFLNAVLQVVLLKPGLKGEQNVTPYEVTLGVGNSRTTKELSSNCSCAER